LNVAIGTEFCVLDKICIIKVGGDFENTTGGAKSGLVIISLTLKILPSNE